MAFRKNKSAYEAELFAPENKYLCPKVKIVQEQLMMMPFTKILLQLLYKDIEMLMRYEPQLSFDFDLGIYLKNPDQSKVQFATFDGTEMSKCEKSARLGVKLHTKKDQLFALYGRTVLRAVGRTYPIFFR